MIILLHLLRTKVIDLIRFLCKDLDIYFYYTSLCVYSRRSVNLLGSRYDSSP